MKQSCLLLRRIQTKVGKPESRSSCVQRVPYLPLYSPNDLIDNVIGDYHSAAGALPLRVPDQGPPGQEESLPALQTADGRHESAEFCDVRAPRAAAVEKPILGDVVATAGVASR